MSGLNDLKAAYLQVEAARNNALSIENATIKGLTADIKALFSDMYKGLKEGQDSAKSSEEY